jgi:hypothetical protein
MRCENHVLLRDKLCTRAALTSTTNGDDDELTRPRETIWKANSPSH